MKTIKLISAAAIAVVAATALIGAGSASAKVPRVVLCKANTPLCAAANLWTLPATIKALSTAALLLGTLTVKCHSEVTIVAEKAEAKQLVGKITLLDWSSCSGCKTATTVAATLPISGAVFAGAKGNGTLETTSKTEVLLKECTVFNLECTASAAKASLSFTGGEIGSTALSEANEVPTVVSGSLCGSEGKWDAGPGESKPYVVKSVNGSTTGQLWIVPESHA